MATFWLEHGKTIVDVGWKGLDPLEGRGQMTHEHAPEREQSLVGDESEATSLEVARERLADP